MCAKLEQETCLRATKYGKCGANETQRGSLAIQMSWQGGGTHKEIVCLSRWNPLVLLYPVGGEGATQ